MRRIALFTSLFLGLTTLVAVPAVITAAPAVALECTGGWVPNSSQTSCIAPIVPAETPPAPVNPPNCGPVAWWNGTVCEPMTGYVAPTTPVVVVPTVPVCNQPSFYEASSNSCKTPAAPALVPVCNAPDFYEVSSNSCKSPQANSPVTGGGTSGSGSGSGSSLQCTNGWVANSAQTGCIAPVAGSGGSSGSAAGNSGAGAGAASCGPVAWWNGTLCEPMTGYVAPTTQGSGGSSAGSKNCTDGWVLNPEQTSCIAPVLVSGGTTFTGNNSGTSGGGVTAQQGADPCLFSTDRSKCEASKLASVSSCSAGSFFDQGIQGCKSATAQSATIACADGSFKVTALECSIFGGAVGSAVAASTGSTCANGYAPNSTGFCVPITTLAGNSSAGAGPSSCGPVDWWNGTSCEPMYGYVAPTTTAASVPVCGILTAWDGKQCAPTITSGGSGNKTNAADSKQTCAARGWTWTTTGSCIAPLLATAAGASLGGSCLEGYFADTAGICVPKGYDNGANIPTGKNLGPTSTSVDPCRVTPVPPSCLASGAVTVSASTVVQAQTARYGPQAPAAGAPANQGSAGQSGGQSGGQGGGAQGGAQVGGGTASSQFTAPPAKSGKAAAPVLIFNVLGSDNKALTDSNGKELTTRPAVKSGNTVFVDKSGSPVITAPTLDPSGRPVTGPDGNVLYTRLMTYAGQEAVTDSSGRAVTASPLLNGSGKALQASNGKVVYAPPVLDSKGNIILNAYGSPLLAQPLSDSSGGIAMGPNGEPIVVQPMVAEGGKAILKNGQPVYVGAAGGQAVTAKNEAIKTAFGQMVTFSNSGSLADEGGNAVLGPDGLPVILSVAGVPISANGSALLDKNGKPIRVTANGGITDSSGRPILGADSKQIVLGASDVATVLKSGKNVIKSTDGKVVTVALNGQLVDATGSPILAAGNKPIFIDPKTKTFKDAAGKIIAISKTGVISAKSSPLAFQTGAIDAA